MRKMFIRPFTFDFHLSVNIGTWNTNLNLFDPFLDNGFKNEYFTSDFPLLMTFIFPSPLVHEIQVWALFDSILGWWRHPGSQNCNISKKWSQKQFPPFKVPSDTYFDVFISLIHDIQLWVLFYPIWRKWHHKRNEYSRILKN